MNIYNQFRDFHVFKRFKYLLGDWWNIDILVVVKSKNKFFYDNINQLHNPVVKSLLGSPMFKNYFLSSLELMMKRKTASYFSHQVISWKQTGLNLFVIPLVVEGSPLEAFVVATGFESKKPKKLAGALSYLGLSSPAVEQKMKTIKSLSPTDEIYIQKMLKILSEEFFALLQEKKKNANLIAKLGHKNAHQTYGTMIGKSPAMKYIFNILGKIKNYDSSILIEGEKGTGKRLLARTIYEESYRSKKAFHMQNFSSFKGSLLELEFFGYSQKAFPKAKKDKKALLEKLNGGTLFLNEIGNTSLKFQAKLLRFLKEGIFFSEGDLKPKKSDVRIISATSQPLKPLIESGQFNEDLYFVLSAMTIKVPPLKSRKEDIPILVDYFLKLHTLDKQVEFSPKALKALYNYSWPGNVRELENEVKRLISLNPESQSFWTEQELSPHIQNFSSGFSNSFASGKQNLKEALCSVEKQILLDCLKKNNWNKTRVAKILGISRTSIILKAREYGIKKESA